MGLKTIEWQSAKAEVSHYPAHPGLRRVTFTFCDDQPNANNQGIKYEDFPDVMASAVGTPIKMKFLGEAAGGHYSSIPIGHISSMVEEEENGVHKLVAEGVLFADDYPDEIEYIEKIYNDKKNNPNLDVPGFSWEITYHEDKSIIENGIQWLKGILTRAATFVRNPAYGNRTAILALASNRELSPEEFFKELTALANDNNPTTGAEGGKHRMDEKELEKLQAALAEAQSKLAEITKELETARTENATLTTENTTLKDSVAEKEGKIAEFTKKELLATRLSTLAQAGVELEKDAEKLEKKKAFYLSFSDEAFAEYVEDIKASLAKAQTSRASAERHTLSLPRFSGREDNDSSNLSDLGSRLKGLSRTPMTNE